MGKKNKAIKHEIRLRLAKREDFIEVDKIVNGKTKWVPRYGIPFWLYNSKGKIENCNYIFSERTDLKEFSNWLVREQILIPKSYFDE